MAFDAGMLYAVTHELNTCLYDAKVEKIGQPSKEEVHIVFRHFGTNKRLCIQAGSHRSRLSFTQTAGENPAVPPMFCTLLRKHLGGAKLLSCEQLGYERVTKLVFSAYDAMGFEVRRYLVCEIMGKYSNLMLLDENHKILGVLRPVDFTTSRLRQVLPGMLYELPPKQDKKPPMEETEEGFYQSLAQTSVGGTLEKYLTATYLGTATQVARELVFRSHGRLDVGVEEADKAALWEAFSQWFDALKAHKTTPTLFWDARGEVVDFAYQDMTHLGDGVTKKTYDTFGELLDACFTEKDKRERVKQKAQDIWSILNRTTARLTRKLEAQEEELRAAEQGDIYQRMGDLVTANIWCLNRGDACLRTVDYYASEPKEVEIPLDTRLSPSANAQRYYKYYTKSKHAKENLALQMEKSREELRYLTTVETFLERAETQEDLAELREELHRAGYASRVKGYAPPKQVKVRPIEYVSPDGGYRILVGRNNIQNDALTFKVAEKGDLWFHCKGYPGSHVIMMCQGEEPTARDYTYAATLAAIHSGAEGGQVPVDYTRIRYVKKPPAAKPGYVTYTQNYTAYVEADKSKLETV